MVFLGSWSCDIARGYIILCFEKCFVQMVDHGWVGESQLSWRLAGFFLKNLLELFTILSHHSFPLPPPFSLDNSLSHFPASWHFLQLQHPSPLRMSLSGRQCKTTLKPFFKRWRAVLACSPELWATSLSAPGRRVVMSLWGLAEV